MAVFTPGLVERICNSGRRLSRKHFLKRLRRAHGEELTLWVFLDCIRRYFVEERWELMEALLDHTLEHHGFDDELDQLRVKMLWCRGDREAALSLARDKMEPEPHAPGRILWMRELLAKMEAAVSPGELEEKWRRQADSSRSPDNERVSVSLYLYGVALDPWDTAAAMAVDEWQGGFRGMSRSSPRRTFGKLKTGLWTLKSPEKDTSAASQTQALLEHLGWPFPPPWRWPQRWSDIGNVEQVQLDVYVSALVRDGSMARTDAWFESGQLAALSELGVELVLSRYPDDE